MKLLLAALLLVALVLPAHAGPTQSEATVDAWGTMRDPMGDVLPYTLTIESATDDACKYNAKTGAPPDTLTTGEPDKVYLLFGPTNEPVNLYVEWKTEATVTWGYVQFKERAVDSDTYTWGSTARFDLGIVANVNTSVEHEFAVGLWDSVRVWAQGSGEGLMSISVYANVLE